MRNGDGSVVLVALDGSREATRAIPLARTVAAQMHARLEAIHVAAAPSPPETAPGLMGLEPSDLKGVPVRVRVGRPSDVILGEIEQPGIELLVLTMLAAGDPERELGSVARDVAINTRRPILAMRPEIGMEKTRAAPVLARLLVPLDGTLTTASALRPITSLAARLGASVDVLYVVTNAAGPGEKDSMPMPRYVDQPHHEWRNWTRELRERLLVECAGFSPSTHVDVHVRRGDPGTEILRFARQGRYDAIVLVRRSRMELDRAATLRRVIRESPCPLLLVGGDA